MKKKPARSPRTNKVAALGRQLVNARRFATLEVANPSRLLVERSLGLRRTRRSPMAFYRFGLIYDYKLAKFHLTPKFWPSKNI